MIDGAADIGRYHRTWLRVLTGIRGCSIADAERWAAPLLAPCPELTLHEPAAKWVAGSLVPPELLVTLDGPVLGQLGRDVQFAMDGGDDFWSPVSDADLHSARDRVGRVLDPYRRGVPGDVTSRVLSTNLTGPVSLDVGVRAVRREWQGSEFFDAADDRPIPVYGRIAFGRSRRVTVRRAEASTRLWCDAFGLNVVVRQAARAEAEGLVAAIGTALELSPGRQTPAWITREAA